VVKDKPGHTVTVQQGEVHCLEIANFNAKQNEGKYKLTAENSAGLCSHEASVRPADRM
jgi:hypothetical protein